MPVLLLIDLQRGMCDPDGPAGRAGLAKAVEENCTLKNANAALTAAREANIEICHVRLSFDEGYVNRTNRTQRFNDHEQAGRFTAGSVESEIRAEVAPAPGETVVNKGSVSPFASTGLLDRLNARGVKEIFIAGVATHLAVESAAREASDRGFVVTVLSDACTAPDPRIHKHAITVTIPVFASVQSTEEFVQTLAASDCRTELREGNDHD